ncbi:hypothetical protein VB002_14335 [Campylobacter concisus]
MQAKVYEYLLTHAPQILICEDDKRRHSALTRPVLLALAHLNYLILEQKRAMI